MFKDYFSQGATAYADFRPRYPDALFTHLAGLAPGRQLAWDCATGNGQAATGLARWFDAVVATDASARQLEQAEAHPRITYRCAPAEQSGLDSGSVCLVTVAQALHWFDQSAFFAEARRVLAPGGVIAAWCYSLLEIRPEIDQVLTRFYTDTVGPWWHPERAMVDDGYRSLDFPFAEIGMLPFFIDKDLALDELLGYVRTWSATRGYQAERGEDPVIQLASDLAAVWEPKGAALPGRWPLHFRVGRV